MLCNALVLGVVAVTVVPSSTDPICIATVVLALLLLVLLAFTISVWMVVIANNVNYWSPTECCFVKFSKNGSVNRNVFTAMASAVIANTLYQCMAWIQIYVHEHTKGSLFCTRIRSLWSFMLQPPLQCMHVCSVSVSSSTTRPKTSAVLVSWLMIRGSPSTANHYTRNKVVVVIKYSLIHYFTIRSSGYQEKWLYFLCCPTYYVPTYYVSI